MRSLLIILGTMLLLAGGFFVYFWMQPATRVTRPETTVQIAPVTRPASLNGESATQPSIGGGESAWLKHFDDKTLELTYEFRGERFQPQKNGTVDVDRPEARFYLDKGQLLVIRGQRGNVVMDNPASPEMKPGASQMPSRGELHDVVISLFPSMDATTPTIVCKMNNAAFDNDTFSINTAGYTDESGKPVAADQVAVEVRGDYEFDGRGLMIRWNERDRRLQLLEIAHGERLLVKDPSAIDKTFGGPTSNPATQLASAPPAPLADEAPKSPTTRKKKGNEAVAAAKPVRVDPIYRASFNQEVRIVRLEAVVATADVMDVDFLTSDKHRATTMPVAPAPSTRAAKKGKKPSTAVAAQATTKPTVQPASAPATRHAPVFAVDSNEAAESVTILWTGKLHVAPIENLEDSPADSRDAVVRLRGAPAVLNHAESDVRAALVSFHTGTEDAVIRGSEQFPLVVAHDSNGATIQSPSIEYSNERRVATLRGASKAELPVAEGARPGEASAMLHAEWTKVARIYLSAATPDSKKPGIERAEFEGDVHIHRPEQLDLKSETLALAFRPRGAEVSPEAAPEPAKRSELREMVATGAVQTVLTDDAGKSQKIDCDRLNLATERDGAGKIYPHVVHASGHVHVADTDQDLHAGDFTLMLKPSRAPVEGAAGSARMELVELSASDDVRIRTASGSNAAGDTLTVKGREGERQVELIGAPTASVGDQESKLQGAFIHFDEASQTVEVHPEGKLHTIQQQDATTRPIDVSWQQRLTVDGASNTVDILGGVVITSNTEDDTTSASGNRMKLLLADKLVAAATTQQPSSAEAPATEPIKLAGRDPKLNALQNKTVKQVTLQENVEVHSKQSNGSTLTQMSLYSTLLDYDMQAKRMSIAAPGRMLFQQDPVAGTTQPSPAPATARTPDLSNLSGATAFEWQKEFRYDEASRQAKMTGDVRIVHQASDLTGPAYELDAGTVIADLDDRPPGESTPTTQPQQTMRVRSVVASDNVTFKSDKLHFEAQHVDYDPNTHILTARGTDGAPAQLLEAEGFSTGTFNELRLNTQTEELDVRGFQAQIRRTK